MTPRELWERHPLAYHMAEPGSWQSIRKLGLLSTSALLDLFKVPAATRLAIETRRRPDPVPIRDSVYGTAVIRDQKPLSEKRLATCLTNGMTVANWLCLLNGRVFLWLDEKRLNVLRGAEAYRAKRQCVLTIEVRTLVEAYGERILLTHMNTGATRPFALPRGLETFCTINGYARRRAVELTIEREIPNIEDFVIRVEEVGGGKAPVLLLRK